MASTRLKLSIVSAFGCAVLGACATVEMSPADAPLSVSNPVEMQSRSLLKTSARRIPAIFSAEGWCAIGAEGQQSAAAILLWGKTKARSVSAPVLNYLDRRAERREVIADIDRAKTMVDETVTLARTFLADNPDVLSVKSELNSLEQALLSARQAEATFAKALEKFDLPADHESLTAYGQSVDALRSATDNFGHRVRGDVAAAS